MSAVRVDFDRVILSSVFSIAQKILVALVRSRSTVGAFFDRTSQQSGLRLQQFESMLQQERQRSNRLAAQLRELGIEPGWAMRDRATADRRCLAQYFHLSKMY
jgi:hypothetical protein